MSESIETKSFPPALLYVVGALLGILIGISLAIFGIEKGAMEFLFLAIFSFIAFMAGLTLADALISTVIFVAIAMLLIIAVALSSIASAIALASASAFGLIIGIRRHDLNITRVFGKITMSAMILSFPIMLFGNNFGSQNALVREVTRFETEKFEGITIHLKNKEFNFANQDGKYVSLEDLQKEELKTISEEYGQIQKDLMEKHKQNQEDLVEKYTISPSDLLSNSEENPEANLWEQANPE